MGRRPREDPEALLSPITPALRTLAFGGLTWALMSRAEEPPPAETPAVETEVPPLRSLLDSRGIVALAEP